MELDINTQWLKTDVLVIGEPQRHRERRERIERDFTFLGQSPNSLKKAAYKFPPF